MFNDKVFRAYDIRGVYRGGIDETFAYHLGYCFAKMHLCKDVYTGYDGRNSSLTLHTSLVNGLIKGGAKVFSCGLCPTPLIYFADKNFKPDCSIMVTGSHNPPACNGFKMVLDGKPFFGEEIQKLRQFMLSEPLDMVDVEDQKAEMVYVVEDYLGKVMHDMVIDKNLKVVWDTGNGSAGPIVEQLIKRLPNKNLAINLTVDGNFPNHHPDPTVPKNLQQIISVVDKENYDLGIAFDGDGDRIGVVTKNGDIIFGDQFLCFFIEDVLRKNPGGVIIADIKASQTLFDLISKFGGNPVMHKAGHSWIKNKMRETNALIAGEMSGHIFFADRYYGYDDAIYSAVRLLDLITRTGKSVQQMYGDLPKVYNTPEIRIFAAEEQKFKIIDDIKEDIKLRALEYNDIDGLRVKVEHGWWLIRASNTEPAIVVRCESNTERGLQILVAEVVKLLEMYDIKL